LKRVRHEALTKDLAAAQTALSDARANAVEAKIADDVSQDWGGLVHKAEINETIAANALRQVSEQIVALEAKAAEDADRKQREETVIKFDKIQKPLATIRPGVAHARTSDKEAVARYRGRNPFPKGNDQMS
jgi:hypothetical protein